MILSKLRRRESSAERQQASIPRLPGGVRAYAIGDVHGRDDLLADMLGRIEDDIGARPPARNHIVLLGDLIDRGPDSRGVVERLRRFASDSCELHVLTGNHEEVLLRILEGEYGILPSWLRFGGTETLASYGVDVRQVRDVGEVKALGVIKSAIPTSHQTFLQSLHDTIRIGDYLFVHAGIRPRIGLVEQVQSDLRWIREPFLSDASNHGFLVVHGHTISEDVVERHNRVGIDTGAYATGRLTALALEGEERWFLEAVGAPG